MHVRERERAGALRHRCPAAAAVAGAGGLRWLWRRLCRVGGAARRRGVGGGGGDCRRRRREDDDGAAAGGAGGGGHEPDVDAGGVEAVAARREHADLVAARELGEADGALRRAAAGEPIEPAGRADDRGDLLRDGASRLLPGYPGASLRRRLVAVIPGRLLAVAHAPRDAERAPGDRVEHEPDDEHAEEEGQDRDHRRVQRAERCRTTRRRRRHHPAVRQKPPGMLLQLFDVHVLVAHFNSFV